MDPSFISSLEDAILARGGRPRGREIAFRCPVHSDENPSARWNPAKAVWCCDPCGAGGGAFDLGKRLGVDLPAHPAQGLTFADLSTYVGIATEFLRSLGLAEGVSGTARAQCVDIPYTDEAGELKAMRKRVRLVGEPRMLWRRGDHAIPYGLSRLGIARRTGYLLLVEGESDCWAAWFCDVPALGLPGASTWREEWARYLDGIEKVYVWREPDQGGDTMTSKVRLSDLPNIFIVDPPAGIKDLNALWHAYGHDKEQFLEKLEAILRSARPASQLRAEALTAEARVLSNRCRHLIQDRNLLGKVEAAIKAAGYVGDTSPPLLAYLAVSSRLLEHPLNLAFVAPSGAGKNRAVDAALALMPPEAFHLEKAGSARALIYSDESYEHRTVIIAEADSIPQDEGSAASAIRSLAEDAYMTYDVVQTNGPTGELHTRRIIKQGPTGLITTSTRPLREQLSTRMLTVTISDSPAQTRAVMLSHAANANGTRPTLDVSDLIDLQRWLQLAGDREVTIPFADALAQLVPDDLVRMRRDFKQLITVIQSVALLHQGRRERDKQGRIMATLEDYAIARGFVLVAFSTAASGGLTPQITETVRKLCEVFEKTGNCLTRKDLADALGLEPRTVGYRVQRAISLGHIVNQETRDRQPARLVPGEPLPEDKPALPTPDDLEAYVSAARDDNRFHASTMDEIQTYGDSESSVETSVETGTSMIISTLQECDSDSVSDAEEPAWKRGNTNGAFNTPDGPAALLPAAGAKDYDCGALLLLAAQYGFPRLQVRAGVSIIGDRESWTRFALNAGTDDRTAAFTGLERFTVGVAGD